MKKKLLYQKLIKSLLDSDFLLIEQKLNNKKQTFSSRFIDTQYSLNNKHNIIYLDIFEVLKDLKQIVRIIFFIYKNNTLKKKFNFFIDTEKNFLEYLLENFFNSDFNVNSHLSRSSRLKEKCIHLGILLDNFLLNNKNFSRNQINRNIFLFFIINSTNERNLVGYKSYNNITDYKKTLFFLSFFKQIVSTYALSKKV